MYRFYSVEITTAGDDEDIIETMQTTLVAARVLQSGERLVAKGLSIISSDNIGLDVNSVGVYSYLPIDADSLYKLNLPIGGVLVSSLKIETTGHVLHIGIFF